MLFDPNSPDVLRDPYPYYTRLRDESPCHEIAGKNVWVVSRYADVVAVLRNHVDFSSTEGLGMDRQPRPMMPMYDPPQHTRLRRLVSPYFTPKSIAALEGNIERHVDVLLQPLVAAGRGDFVDDFAVPLALGVIAGILGMPLDRIDDLRRWSEGALEGLAGSLSSEAAEVVEKRRREFVRYLNELMTERRAAGASSSSDLIGQLATATAEDRLTPNELIAFCLVLLVAGFETTVVGLTNGLRGLLQHPDEHRLVRENHALIPTLIEEFVRYDSPNQGFFRNTLRAVTVAGVEVPKDAKVMVLYGSANRDPRQFDQPDVFRAARKPNDHVAYGAGIHYCLGAPLARVQLTIATRALLRLTKDIELDGDITRASTMLMRRVRHMPVRLVAA